MRQICTILLLAALMACSHEKSSNPTGPTPGGQPQATKTLTLWFIPSCNSDQLSAPSFDQALEIDVPRSSYRPNNVEIPSCMNIPASSYSLVITSRDLDLSNAIQLTRALTSNESWSGALMWARLYSNPTGLHGTNIPFTPGVTDHFSMVGLQADKVDISLLLQPGGTVQRIPVLIAENKTEVFGLPTGWGLRTPGNGNNEYRIVGLLPRR